MIGRSHFNVGYAASEEMRHGFFVKLKIEPRTPISKKTGERFSKMTCSRSVLVPAIGFYLEVDAVTMSKGGIDEFMFHLFRAQIDQFAMSQVG